MKNQEHLILKNKICFMKINKIVFIILTIISCTNIINNDKKDILTNKSITDKLNFSISDLVIRKSQLGKIKIGMTIQEAEQKISGFKKKKEDALNYGFGGNGLIFTYYFQNDPIFSLVPKMETDTIRCIIVLSEKLKTINGLNINSTINDFINKYNEFELEQDFMNEWEFFMDKINKWEFIFIAKDGLKIGEYIDDYTVTSKPKRFDVKPTWITIW
jgi:hypothetical protein